MFEWEYKYAVGWAMVGRGELGFVMAEAAYKSDLTSELTFSVTVWALLLATLLSPICFRMVLGSDSGHTIQDKEPSSAGTMTKRLEIESVGQRVGTIL